ncbi:protein of unknown function [Brochothrix thermosphacta]|uniref:Uncharacterized protein n=1 Tax=Brochothrix thermosphacta TaxID=2756 RepID=A0A2X0R4M4_BROTH|nr:hypothetical protein BTH160X_100066 [Brochothrix thermosphacta]SPN72827.1 protein of unknown function [Brochothrix thermosphacta]SPP29060.1 hypothetical protein BTBSAS_40083 [Brochothrix thermosphacta]
MFYKRLVTMSNYKYNHILFNKTVTIYTQRRKKNEEKRINVTILSTKRITN